MPERVEAAGALADLKSCPTSLCLWGSACSALKDAPALSRLQKLEFDLERLPEAEVRQLAGWLPRLQCLQLVLPGQASAVCDLGLLSMLAADRLCVRLIFDQASCLRGQTHVCDRLEQLAAVQLHSLELWCTALSHEQRLLLARCQVRGRVLLRLHDLSGASRQLPRLRAGASVVHDRWPSAAV